jgi:hypothetical protein
MGNRTKVIQTILDLWGKGNIRPIIQQFSMYSYYNLALMYMLHPMYYHKY